MTRNVESIFGAVVTAPHQIPYTYTATGGEKFISLPFYPVTGVVTINGGMQVPLDNFEIDGNTLNLGRALSKGDVVFCLFDKVLSPEDHKPGIRIYKFQAVGGETEFTPDFTSYGVQSLYIGGEYKTPEIEYSYNSTTGKVSLQTALTAGVWVVAEMSVKQPNISPLFDRSIQEIARATNVKDSEVILSTDTTQVLNGKKVVYSVGEQKAYGLPTLPTNVYIHSVADGKLTYAPGNVVVDLLPAPSTVRNELASGNGASMVGINTSLPGGVPRTLMQRAEEYISVKDFGAKGDGITNDTTAFTTACTALQSAFDKDGIRRTLWVPDGSYRTDATINIHQNMTIHCGPHVVFQNIGVNKSFPAIELFGGACRSQLGVIDSYGIGIRLRGNTHDVNFQTISNCTDGLVIRAGSGSKVDGTGTNNNLDNKITGIQIGKCTNGIVFEQNANELIQQGNEIRVNFVSETQNTVLFRNYDGFTHTKMSNWDSNFIELIASDPLEIADSSMIRNITPYGVPNVTLLVQSWCGGWVPDAGTICLIRGAFSVSTFKFNLAQRVGLDELVDAAGRSSLGSCSVDLCRFTNLGNASSFYQAVTPGSVFNNGIPLHQKKFRIRVSIPDINSGSVHGMAFSHVLAQVSNTARFTIVNAGGAPTARNGLLFELTDAGAESRGMVRIWCRNISSSTVAARDVDLIIIAE